MDLNILGIGPLELVVILIIALAVFGPDRLPQIGSKLGKAMKDMRKTTREFSREIDQARAAIEAPAKEITEPFKEAGTSLKDIATTAQAFRNPGQALRQAAVREIRAAETAPLDEATAAADVTTVEETPRIAPPGLTGPAAAPSAAPADSAAPAPVQPDAEPASDSQQPPSGTEA